MFSPTFGSAATSEINITIEYIFEVLPHGLHWRHVQCVQNSLQCYLPRIVDVLQDCTPLSSWHLVERDA